MDGMEHIDVNIGLYNTKEEMCPWDTDAPASALSKIAL